MRFSSDAAGEDTSFGRFYLFLGMHKPLPSVARFAPDETVGFTTPAFDLGLCFV
jgi:hypothetical protein